MDAAAAIVKILRVHDTREYIEDGDRWVAVPGSGILRPCDRCTRSHEIHVEVELADGSRAVIGQGCARGETLERTIRLRVAAEQARVRLARQLEATRAQHAAARRAWDMVAAMTHPEPTLTETSVSHGRTLQIWSMGSARVYCHAGFDDERRRCLIDAWRRDRYAERMDVPRGAGGYPRFPASTWTDVTDLERRLEKIERKLASDKIHMQEIA